MTSFERIKAGIVNIIFRKAGEIGISVFCDPIITNHEKNCSTFKNLQGHFLSHDQTFLYCSDEVFQNSK